MTMGLKEFTNRYGYSALVLIGHSGGGSLVMLLSRRLPQTKLLLTLSGNYDINLWADYHGYQRLSKSENPADYVNQGILEWHYLGAEDNNIPPNLFMHLLESRSNSRVEVLSGVAHQQGWLVYWPEILSRLNYSH
jgi:triacylglycerol esterase/lipase EstA (alpha/beta hydrolase family)